MRTNRGDRFERLPPTPADRSVEGRPARSSVLDYFETRFGLPGSTFADLTFWEKGAGKIWASTGDLSGPIGIEAVGLLALRARQAHWKPTTNFIQRFGRSATRNVVDLDAEAAARFVAGEDHAVEWSGDWGYLIVATEVAGETEPLGVGLYTHGTLRSQVPKGRRVALERWVPVDDARPD